MAEVLAEAMSGYVGRLAPSPTGALHLGNARTFMIAWLRARSQGGKVIFRMEDLDHPKDKPGAAAQAIEDLKWLGFDWDEAYVQSERKAVYREALEALRAAGLVYPCVCSRRDVEAAQSAPHAGEQLHYPGICRGKFKTWQEAVEFKHRVTETQRDKGGKALCLRASVFKPCWRFRVPENTVVSFDDAFAGHYEQNVSETLGDFPLARDEFGAGYTLACVVDDLLMGVTEVVRGDDLLPATPAQILLAKSLVTCNLSTCQLVNCRLPSYCHVPLVVGRDGKRLAKRHGDTRISAYRAAGVPAERILGFLASTCGWGDGGPVALRDLLPCFTLDTIPHAPCVVPPQLKF